MKPIIVRLYQPDAKGRCAFEDRSGEWEGVVFMPVAAILQLRGDPYGYFEGWPRDHRLEIGDRVPDETWPESEPVER